MALQRFKRIQFVALLLLSPTVLAEPIVYKWQANGQGGFNGVAFSRPIKLALHADTDNVIQTNSGWSVHGQLSAVIEGLGYAVYQEEMTLVSNTNRQVVSGTYGPFFSANLSIAEEYNLKSSFGPHYTSSPMVMSGDYLTSGGRLSLVSVGPSLFQASFAPQTAPIILQEPPNQSAPDGSAASLNVTMDDSTPHWVQWWKGESRISGANSAKLSIANASALDSGNYHAVITNLFGATKTRVATLTVYPAPPTITTNPISQGRILSNIFVLSAKATGTLPIGWQWYFNGQPMTNATKESFNIKAFEASMAGNYYAVASNSLGMATTDVAHIDVSAIVYYNEPVFIPYGSDEITSITGGDNHFLALRANGEVEAWGTGSVGQNVIPPGISNLVSITAGSTHSLVVQKDGDTALWGQFIGTESREIDPAARRDVAMVAKGVGAQHGVALRKDGTLVDWGTWFRYAPELLEQPPGLTNLVSVAAGAFTTLALRSDGTVFCWGHPINTDHVTPPVSATGIVAVAAGYYNHAALRKDGSVITWGYGFEYISTNANFVDIACNYERMMGIAKDGGVHMQSGGSYLKQIAKGEKAAGGIEASRGTFFIMLGRGKPKLRDVAIDRRVGFGETAYFYMRALGELAMTNQWSFNGTPMEGETNTWLEVKNVQPANVGVYTFTASNSQGTVISKGMGLNLPELKILSARADGDTFEIQVQTVLGEHYRLESQNAADGSIWENVEELDAVETATTFAGAKPSDGLAQKFYRIRRW